MPHLSRLSLNYCRCMVTASISTDAAPNLLNTVKRKNRRSDASDKFGLLGSFGRGLPFFRPSKNDTSDLQGDDTRKEYEKKTEGLRKFELKEQKTIPLISQPVSWTRVMKKKLERKKKALDEFKRLYGVDYEYARVLIRCARKEYNHYEGMKYPMKEIPLVSQYWIKPKYKNDWFIIEPVGKIPSFDHDRDYCWEQFFDTLDGNVVQNAINVGYLKPTTIQVQTFAAFASSSHLFILAETGSGKTAAYAIPLLSSLLKERRCEVDTKALVLVVSAELMVQTRRMIEKLAAGTGLKFYREDSESKEFDNAEVLTSSDQKDWDVLISTPGLACKVLSKCDTRLIKTVIFDEADMLLDDTFVSVLSEIFSLVKLRNSETNQNNHEGARIVFCSASCPDLLQDIVDSVVDAQSLYYVKSIHTHGLLPHVRQKFIRVRQMDKIDMLATILEKPNTRGQTIIFCKDKNTRSYVSKMLTARGINNSVLGDHDRKETFINLVDNDKGIIIATDLASRGLDLPNLSHVINYDFPRDMIDYIHRIGRVGRLSTKFRSRATSFVCTSLEVSLVNSIELAARFNQPVNSIKTNVSASFKQRKKLVENTS